MVGFTTSDDLRDDLIVITYRSSPISRQQNKSSTKRLLLVQYSYCTRTVVAHCSAPGSSGRAYCTDSHVMLIIIRVFFIL